MDMEQLGENLNQFFLRYVSTRWLTMGPVVQRALNLWDSTVTYFLVFLTDPKATQIDSAINTSQHNISLLITLLCIQSGESINWANKESKAAITRGLRSEDNKVKDTCFKQVGECETRIADLSERLSSLQKKLARLCEKKPKEKE